MSYSKDKDTFQNTIRELESSWKSDRYSHCRRPYEPEHIASKRSSLNYTLPAQLTSKKLWELFNKCKENKTASITFDCPDPKQILAMVKNLDTVYVSNLHSIVQGYEESNNEKLVKQISKLQEWSDRRQQEYRYQYKSDKSTSDIPLPNKVDFFSPIIVDADCPNGNVARTMRHTKDLIEHGASGIQIEDCEFQILAHGTFPVLMPMSDHINRLVAIRAQSDIMNSDTVIISKNCGLGTTFILDTSDMRDHPYILGATVPGQPLAEVLKQMQGAPKEELTRVLNEWCNQTQCVTYREAIALAMRNNPNVKDLEKAVHDWMTKTLNLGLNKVMEMAKEQGFENVYWDSNLCRSIEGFYAYSPTFDAVKSRALHVAPYCDMIALKTNTRVPPIELMKDFADFAKREIPKNFIGFNYPPLVDFNVVSNGIANELIEQLNMLTKEGYIWHSLILNDLQTAAVASDLTCQQQFQKEIFAFSEKLRSKIPSAFLPSQSEDKGYSDYAGKILAVLNATIYPTIPSVAPQVSNQSSPNQEHHAKPNIGNWVKDKLGFGHNENPKQGNEKNQPVYDPRIQNVPMLNSTLIQGPISTFSRSISGKQTPRFNLGSSSPLINLDSPGLAPKNPVYSQSVSFSK